MFWCDKMCHGFDEDTHSHQCVGMDYRGIGGPRPRSAKSKWVPAKHSLSRCFHCNCPSSLRMFAHSSYGERCSGEYGVLEWRSATERGPHGYARWYARWDQARLEATRDMLFDFESCATAAEFWLRVTKTYKSHGVRASYSESLRSARTV